MSCVNTNSKAFKDLARHYNIDVNSLELITHKYWLETGSEEGFPTKLYMDAQRGLLPYYEKSSAVRDLWERKYKEPIEVTTEKELANEISEAEKYFPKSAIVFYTNNSGKYVLRIREPEKVGIPKILRNPNSLKEEERGDYYIIVEKYADELEKNGNFAEAKDLNRRTARWREADERIKATLASIDSAVKAGEWSEKTLNELENLIKNIQNGKVDFKRTVGERRSLKEGVSEVHAGASLILRGKNEANRRKSGNPQEKYENLAKEGKEQEKIIEAWAKAADLWVNDYTDPDGKKANTLEDLLHSQWQYLDQGSEAEVFLYDDKTVLKSISLSHSDENPQQLLDRIELFNQLFPETALSIVGFGRDSSGHFRVLATQNYVNGRELTEEELEDFHKKYKFKKSGAWFATADKTALFIDLSPSNILKDKDGNYIVVDVDVVYNTPDRGGKVQFEDSIAYSEFAIKSNSFDDAQKTLDIKKTPHPFTFKDGTTINAPFLVNEEQAEALNAMNDFIHSNETSMTLSGYAGTGKTSLMEMIAKKMNKDHISVVFSATTNKATMVLQSKVGKSGHQAYTLNKVFGINVEIDSSQAYNARKLVNVLKPSDILDSAEVVIIDEASMINSANYDILNDIAERNGIKIIYVGDEAQLAPVGEDKISKVFRNTEGRVVKLTKVERTEDNAILKEATDLRNGKALSGESSFNAEGEGVAYIRKNNKEELDKIISHFVEGLKDNPDFFRILAYTNAAVTRYNESVRKTLGYSGYVPKVGEPMIGYANWGYEWRSKSYRFVNSESYKVVSVGRPYTKQMQLSNGTPVQMEAVPISLQNSLGVIDTFDFIDIKGNAQNKQGARLLAEEKAKLWEIARTLPKEGRREVLAQINYIEQSLFVNDAIEGQKGNLLQAKTIDFGYALTVHKSQGSTFTNVLIDDIDINKASSSQDPFAHDLETVELGDESSKTGEGLVPDQVLDVDLGSLEEESGEPNAPLIAEAPKPKNTADIRQQLKYVAVSRATNTATIISNNVKKEGSPLNHVEKKSTKEASLPKESPKANADGYADFDTSVIRPFTHTLTPDSRKFVKQPKIRFQSIEQAFQFYKTLYASRNTGNIKDVIENLQQQILQTTDPIELQRLGKQVPMDEVAEYSWELSAKNILDNLQRDANRQGRQVSAQGEEAPSNTPKPSRSEETVPEIPGLDSKTLTALNDVLGIEIDANLRTNYREWKKKNPNGIIAYRKYGTDSRTFTPNTVADGWIGNPFSIESRDYSTVIQFYDWIVSGNNFGNEFATDEYRQAIIERLRNAPEDAKVLYYKKLSHPSHATIIAYLIHNKHLLPVNTTKGEIKTISEVYTLLKDKFEADSSQGKLLDLVFKTLNLTNVKFAETTLEEGTCGYYSASENLIYYDPNNLLPNTLLHEAIHAVTSYYLRATDIKDFPKEVRTAILEIQECYNLLKQDFIETHLYDNGKLREGVNVEKAFKFWITGNDTYGYTSPTEMIAELSNPEFVEHIKNFDKRHKGQNIFTRLKNAVLSIFGLNKKYGSLEVTLKNALVTLLTNPSKELMQRYSVENETLKKNHEALTQSNAVELMHRVAFGEFLKNIPGNAEDVDYAVGEFTFEEEDLQDVFQLPNGISVKRLRDLKKGTIFIHEGAYFMTLEDTPYIKDGKVVVPLRIYSEKGLSNNTFVIHRDSTGLDYVADTLKNASHMAYANAAIEGTNTSQASQEIIVAPYFREKLTSTNKNDLEKATKEVKERATKLAKALNLEIEEIETIGGTYRGSSEISYKYRIKSSDQQKVDLFAALMGDLSLEYQDAVIAANYVSKNEWNNVPDSNKAIELCFSVPEGVTIENIETALQELGIEGSSFSFKDNILSIMAFSNEDMDIILTKLNNTQYEIKEFNRQNSRYLDNESRRSLYEAWISSERGQQNRSLYNACLKAIAVCEAAAKFPGENQETERLNATRDAVAKWDAEHTKRASEQQASTQPTSLETSIDKATKKYSGNWTRQEAQANPRVLYVFTDNTDRDSGSNTIPSDSWYSKKYGEGHHYPTMTAAVVRGLDNARPISTQRWYHQGAKGNTGRWTDANIEEFKKTIRVELEEIVSEFNTGKYDTIMFPDGDGLFNTRISNITKERTPQLYQALADLLHEYGFDSLIPDDVKPSSQPKTFVPQPVQMENLAIETGERLIQVDKEWKEADLLRLDAELSKATTEEERQRIVDEIHEVQHAVERVSLPGYEEARDLDNGVLVDAEWKISYLKDLDSEINDDLSQEQLSEILNSIDEVLNATSEEDYLSDNEDKKAKEVEETLDEFEKLTNQINALLDSELITASEIRHTAELIIDSISDTITSIQTEEGYLEKYFPEVNTDIDLETASRKEIVEAVGINTLINITKQRFSPENSEYDDIQTILQAQAITDNWDAIMVLASDIFAMNEGFGIMKDYSKGNFTTTNSTVDIEFGNYNEYNTPEDIQEQEGDEQEHWQVESRTIDTLNSMSELVRQAIRNCYDMDKEGNIITSKWGIPERVNPRNAVNGILRWTQGALTLEDMIKKLTEKQGSHKWLGQLISRLNDTSGKEADFQSQFFNVFCKHFQLYSIVLTEEGKYTSIPVNKKQALTEAIQTITTQYKIGEHALFTNSGKVAQKSLDLLKKFSGELSELVDRINHGESIDEDMAKDLAANISAASKILGYMIPEEMLNDILSVENVKLMANSLHFIVASLESAKTAQDRDKNYVYEPFKFGADNNIGGSLRNFLTPITDILEDTAINAFYDSGKMYQSYVTPSFMTKLMNKFKLEGQDFEDFIMKEFGNTEWFKAKKDKWGKDISWDINEGWRNEWLRLLATDKNAREIFEHKVELNFNKHNYMRNMNDSEYALSLITEYFSEAANAGDSMVPAWFRVPMLSNKPSSEFIKFYSYRGSNYKDVIVDGLYEMFLQELSRIQTVKMRNKSKNSEGYISNFDNNGLKFNFLPFLNKYLFNEKSTLGKLLRKKTDGYQKLTSEEEAQLLSLAKQTIKTEMQNSVDSILDSWENSDILEAAKKIKGIDSEASVREQIENFLWNDSYAAKNILQLTVTDIAFYKNAEDLQKRLAQLHAPGTRANVKAIDYEGTRVSDGTYRTVLLADFETFKSNIIENITEVFNRKITRASDNEKAQLIALRDSLVGKNGRYRKINVTDGQGYSSPTSYRKKAFMFGKWSRSAEDIYQKLLSGEYRYTDLETAFQPLKPFVYSHLNKDLGVPNAPITSIPAPFQAKNSEYLLIMADAIIKGEEKKSGKLGRPNLLRAIYRVMEDSAYDGRTYDENGKLINKGTYNGKGIDTVQFGSAIKSGLQTPLDINPFLEMEGGEEAAYNYLRNQIYKEEYDNNENRIYQTYNIDSYVHEASFEDYCLQQEVPAHFKDHSQAHGSQIRMITPADLDMYKNPNGDLNDENNKVYYEWTEPDGTVRKVSAKEFKKEYEQTIADNIEESIDTLIQEFHLTSLSKKERNLALSKVLQREILSSPRYGIDLIQACSIDKATGEFRIPKGDPIQAKRIEQLINSIIKSRVNKQKIAGGPIVQVTNYGTSKQLHIRFKDHNGDLLLTEEEFNDADKGAAVRKTYKNYKEYIKKEQAGIAYFEVFIPIWSNELFEKFGNSDGTINIEAIEATDPELLKMISYRIPTEDKYSCAPMKAVGFMPREAGDAIMLPYELTEIDDSDFDVDKRYVMRKDIPIIKNDFKDIKYALETKLSQSYEKAFGKVDKRFVKEKVRDFLTNPERMRHSEPLMESMYKTYQSIAYTTNPPTSGRKYRDNKIIDMTFAVLTNEMTAPQILNPGGFDPVKKMGYLIEAYRNVSDTYAWEDLEKLSIDELKELSYTSKDLTMADAQIQFYRQNAAGSNLIGVFAVNKVAHAILEDDHIELDATAVLEGKPVKIAGMNFGGMMVLDPKYDTQGTLVGKTLGSNVSASADTAKEPVLELMNINMTTVGVLCSMMRLGRKNEVGEAAGMSFQDACLFMSQDIIKRMLNAFNKANLNGYESLDSVIDKWLDYYREKHNVDEEDSTIDGEEITKKELITGLTKEEHEEIDYKVLLAFKKLRKLANEVKKPTFATRFNSISSAVGPLIIDNLIIEHKMDQFSIRSTEEDTTNFYNEKGEAIDINYIFDAHPVLRQFSKTVEIARNMFADMPVNSTGFRHLLNTIPTRLSDTLYNDKKLLDQLSLFYQSYLLIKSGFIDPKDLKYYIEDFPKEFSKISKDEKYADNALIQAMHMNVSKRTGRAFLQLNLTGLDESTKEVYRSAWIDLHKKDPELSTKLFKYSFFRAGIGFSPKTIMALVPTYVKERLSTTLPSGQKITYLDVYRNLPEVNPYVVLDQWVRNNWDNGKLVPKKDIAEHKYIIDKGQGNLYARTEEDRKDLEGVTYFKTKIGNETYLWKQVIQDKYTTQYKRVKPLGQNSEYLEMDISDIKDPMNDTLLTVDDIQESEIQETSHNAIEEDSISSKKEEPSAKAVAEFVDLMMQKVPNLNKTEALNRFENIRKNPENAWKFIQNVFKQKGLDLTREEAIKKFKEKLC